MRHFEWLPAALLSAILTALIVPLVYPSMPSLESEIQKQNEEIARESNRAPGN